MWGRWQYARINPESPQTQVHTDTSTGRGRCGDGEEEAITRGDKEEVGGKGGEVRVEEVR